MIVNEEMVKEALKEVYDPELGLDVVNLGLIYEIRITQGKDVYVKMTLTAPGCPIGDLITTAARERIKQIPGVENVEVELTFDPLWTPDRMSDEAKMMLGFLPPQ